jgi:hypothetical protein
MASVPGIDNFRGQWLAFALPCRSFADVIADANSQLGADVVRHSFIMSDFDRLLLAGLAAHWIIT